MAYHNLWSCRAPNQPASSPVKLPIFLILFFFSQLFERKALLKFSQWPGNAIQKSKRIQKLGVVGFAKKYTQNAENHSLEV